MDSSIKWPVFFRPSLKMVTLGNIQTYFFFFTILSILFSVGSGALFRKVNYYNELLLKDVEDTEVLILVLK